jgi:hypothetical protein
MSRVVDLESRNGEHLADASLGCGMEHETDLCAFDEPGVRQISAVTGKR